MMQEQTMAANNSFDPAFVITHSGRVGSTIQQNAAAAFFAKKHQKCGAGNASISSSNPLALGRYRQSDDSETPGKKQGKPETTFSNFSTVLAKCPPPPPAHLIKKINESRDVSSSGSSVGKVRVILRVANSRMIEQEKKCAFFKMDKKKKQVTLYKPENRDYTTTENEVVATTNGQDQEAKRSLDVSAPKMFAFDKNVSNF